MGQKINDLQGIRDTFAALPKLEKVHIMEDGRHFFDEAHAKEANGYTSKTENKKITHTANKVKYTSYGRDDKALDLPTTTPATPATPAA